MSTWLIVGLILAGFYVVCCGGRLFHLASYSASLGSVTNNDVTAASDLIFGTRNNHIILTDRFNVIAAHGMGSLLSRLRFNNSQLTQFAIPHLWPLSVSATVEDLPPVIDFRGNPLALPMNEEIVVEATTTGAGPSRVELSLFLGAPNWTPQLSTYQWKGIIRGTVVIAAGAEGAYTALSTGVFERDPLNGVYEVFGAELVAANAVSFRIRFPDMPNVAGKQLRPGGLVQDTASLEPWRIQRGEMGGLGPWGRFHTFTPPQWEVFGDAAGGTYEFRLHCGYVGQDRNLVAGVAGASGYTGF